jgi:Ca-activated chloride channel family protein
MEDRDLERLKTAAAPAPRPEAKARALAAAHAAFASAGEIQSSRDEVDKNAQHATKGNPTTARHTHASPNTRRNWMRASHAYAMAASVAAVSVAAPMAYHLLRNEPGRTAPPAPSSAPSIAPDVQRDAAQVEIAAASAAAKVTEAAEQSQRAVRAETRRQAAEKPIAEAAQPNELSRLAPPPPSDYLLHVVPPAPAAPPPSRAFKAIEPGTARLGGNIAMLPPVRPVEPVARPSDRGRDRFDGQQTNPVKSVATEPVSTFSIDVDTASYAFVRRALNAGRLPPKAAVRVEELINYFPYDYARPDSAETPFSASIEVFPSPWSASNKLVHIGLKGYELRSAERPRANLVLLVDVSGSMGPDDRLPLVKNAFRLLLDNLRPEDTIAIVTYASGSDIRLEPTKVADRPKILAAIDSLRAGGSTHGAAGITDAYKLAEASFDKAAVNRVILATDGDWNVGITNRNELKGFVERKRQTGIYLSILGVGMGNHNDALMQALAQNGNGAAAYIDTLNEARKVLVDQASSTMFPIARDVKVQIEFNPAQVSEYRLIGYETRMLRREDFNNDKVDAGDVGSAHSVTAIYEITPVGAPRLTDELRYHHQPATATATPPTTSSPTTSEQQSELGFLKLRYKLPKEEASRLATFAIGPAQTRAAIKEASSEARFSTAVAAFGQLLKGATYVQGYTFDEVIALANGAKGEDPFGYRAEFVNLVRLAKSARATVEPQ